MGLHNSRRSKIKVYLYGLFKVEMGQNYQIMPIGPRNSDQP